MLVQGIDLPRWPIGYVAKTLETLKMTKIKVGTQVLEVSQYHMEYSQYLKLDGWDSGICCDDNPG